MRYKIFFLIFLIACGHAWAVGNASASPAEGASTGTWTDWLIMAALSVATAGGAVITWFFKVLTGRLAKTQAQQEAMQALEAGVTQAYFDLVSRLKQAAADGSLTPEEKKQCRDYAIEQAKAVATGPGLRALTAMALPMLQNLVEQIVLRRKAAAGQAAGANTNGAENGT
jgi:hypothetical protein